MRKRLRKSFVKTISIIMIVIVFVLSFGEVALAADITIANNQMDMASYPYRTGIYWVSKTTGYAFYNPSAGRTNRLNYSKTTDGGATWGASVELGTTLVDYWHHWSAWADWETVGDHGTKIYFAGYDYFNTDIEFFYFDTATETATNLIQVQTLPSCPNNYDLTMSSISIVKSVGGTLAISYRVDGDTIDSYGFETSIDGGNTWVAKSSPWEAAFDHFMLYPANLTDEDDIWGVFWDIDTDELSLKTYDDSGDSWSEQLIESGMADDNDDYLQMDGDIRHSDGDLILAAWDKYSSSNATLKVWDINGAGDITELTEVADNATGCFQTDVFVDQTTNYIYVSYLKGTIESSVEVDYQLSTDGGTTWNGEVTFSETNDDIRNVWTSGIRSGLGGRYMPIWYNQDLGDVLTNYIHSIEITGYEYEDVDPAEDIPPDYDSPNIAEPIRNDVPGVGFPTHWFGCEDHDFSTMPVYDAFSSVSTEMGIPIENLYLLGILGIAFGVFLLIVMYVRSALIGSIAFNMVLVFGAMMCILPLWIPFAAGVTQAGIMFMYKQVAY